jgi:hypothetical protein
MFLCDTLTVLNQLLQDVSYVDSLFMDCFLGELDSATFLLSNKICFFYGICKLSETQLLLCREFHVNL